MLNPVAVCAAAMILSVVFQAAALARGAAVHAAGPALASAAGHLGQAGSIATVAMAHEVLAARDHRGLPFAVVDKRAAQMSIYRADGALAGVSAVLLGQDPGDRSVPGVGERTQTGRLRPGDRTTPAGRYVSEPGRNRSGETVVWVDFEAALAIHRLRPHPAGLERARRLASGRAEERRLSAGCIVVPVAFYLAVVQPLLGKGPAVIYVLSESHLRAADGRTGDP